MTMENSNVPCASGSSINSAPEIIVITDEEDPLNITDEDNHIDIMDEDDHMASQSRAEILCPECSETFWNREDFLIHATIHIQMNTPEQTYTCMTCSFKLDSATMLTAHQYILDDDLFECQNCTQKFRSHCQLILHMLNPHCPHCLKSFKSKGNMKRHLKTHTRVRIQCVLCSKNFLLEANFNKHMQTHIRSGSASAKQRPVPFVGPNCLTLIRNSDGVTEHVQEMDPDTIAANSTASSSQSTVSDPIPNVNGSMSLEDNDLENLSADGMESKDIKNDISFPYACVHCNIQFRSSRAMSIHVLRSHVKEKVWGCTKCKQHGFCTKLELMKHQNTLQCVEPTS